MDKINVEFCFYDDPDYLTDADRDSRMLRQWHQRLWSKSLPGGQRIHWEIDPGTSCLVYGEVRVSSDTICDHALELPASRHCADVGEPG